MSEEDMLDGWRRCQVEEHAINHSIVSKKTLQRVHIKSRAPLCLCPLCASEL